MLHMGVQPAICDVASKFLAPALTTRRFRGFSSRMEARASFLRQSISARSVASTRSELCYWALGRRHTRIARDISPHSPMRSARCEPGPGHPTARRTTNERPKIFTIAAVLLDERERRASCHHTSLFALRTTSMNVRMPGTPCSASRDALDDLPSTRHRGGGAMRDAVLSERTAILIESIYCIRAHTTPIPARNCVQSPDYEDIDSMDVASEAKRR